MDIVQLKAILQETNSPNTNSLYTYLAEPASAPPSHDEYPSSLLSYDIESCLGGIPAEPTKVCICVFRNNDHHIVVETNPIRKINVPHISYYMEYEKHHFTFPSFHHDWADSAHDEYEMITTSLKSKCIMQMMNTLGGEQIPSIIPPEFGYRGIIYHNNTIYAFFDFTNIARYFHFMPITAESEKAGIKGVWAIIDEIVNRNKIFSTNVDSHVVSLFNENSVLWNIHYAGEPFLYPQLMYAAIEIHDTPEDVDEDSPQTYRTDYYGNKCEGKSCIHTNELESYSYSDVFAERYLFTKEPIPERDGNVPLLSNGLPAYKRFACFIYNPTVVFSKEFTWHRTKWLEQYPNNFIENIREQLYQSHSPDDSDDIYEDDDLIEKYRNIPCIFFKQKIAHHRATQFAGLIHPDLFTEIDMV
jgi:hypothetical protein